MITTIGGSPVRPLGLAAHPKQQPGCVRRAFEGGVNYYFFYGPGHTRFIEELTPIARKRREDVVVASGSGSRKPSALAALRRKIERALGVEHIDIFFAEYIHSWDDPHVIFGKDGVLDELERWKRAGEIRYVGATVHDRTVAQRLAQDDRVDVLMHRFNMAHRKAAREVFPTAIKTRTAIVAFTATRWGTLLQPAPGLPGDPPSASDCYRYCLAHRAVQLVLSAPRSIRELRENLTVLEHARMKYTERRRWESYGDRFYRHSKDAFETRWP